MSELITLSRKDPNFKKYLDGSFSDLKRALPIKSLNVNTEMEQVTFVVVDVNSIGQQPIWYKWAHILKLKNLLWLVFPMFLITVKNLMDGNLKEPNLAVLSFLGAIFLHAAASLRNDYLDHIRGLDRIHPKSGSRAIQKGWITANQVKNISWIFALAGIAFGVPAVLQFTELLIMIVTLAVVALFGMSSYSMGLKYRRWSEITVFLLLGPLLTLGYQVACGAGLDWEALCLGVTTGWFAVFYLHLKNFEELVVHSQAQFNNTITWLGFEKSKKLLAIWWMVFLGLFNSYHFVFGSLYWAWFLGLCSVVSSVSFLVSLKDLESPVGSGMTSVVHQARYMAIFMMSFWFLENIWYLWVNKLWF